MLGVHDAGVGREGFLVGRMAAKGGDTGPVLFVEPGSNGMDNFAALKFSYARIDKEALLPHVLPDLFEISSPTFCPLHASVPYQAFEATATTYQIHFTPTRTCDIGLRLFNHSFAHAGCLNWYM